MKRQVDILKGLDPFNLSVPSTSGLRDETGQGNGIHIL